MERNNTCYAFSSIASIYESLGKEKTIYPESVNRRVCGILRAYIDVEKLSQFISNFEDKENIQELSPSLQKSLDLLSSKPITSSKDAPVFGLLENEGSYLILRLDGLAGPKKPNVGDEAFFLGRLSMYENIPTLSVEFKLPVPQKKASSQANTATPIASPVRQIPSQTALPEPVRT